MVLPKNGQVCAIRLTGQDDLQFAVWDTGYSMYGTGGHFVLAGGGMAGLPIDVDEWGGTHWEVSRDDNIAIPYQHI